MDRLDASESLRQQEEQATESQPIVYGKDAAATRGLGGVRQRSGGRAFFQSAVWGLGSADFSQVCNSTLVGTKPGTHSALSGVSLTPLVDYWLRNISKSL